MGVPPPPPLCSLWSSMLMGSLPILWTTPAVPLEDMQTGKARPQLRRRPGALISQEDVHQGVEHILKGVWNNCLAWPHSCSRAPLHFGYSFLSLPFSSPCLCPCCCFSFRGPQRKDLESWGCCHVWQQPGVWVLPKDLCGRLGRVFNERPLQVSRMQVMLATASRNTWGSRAAMEPIFGSLGSKAEGGDRAALAHHLRSCLIRAASCLSRSGTQGGADLDRLHRSLESHGIGAEDVVKHGRYVLLEVRLIEA